MSVSPTTRRVQVFIALLIATALLLRFSITTFGDASQASGESLLTRWLHYFSFFTIQSNIVCLVAALAVVRGATLDSPGQRALRLASLMGITVTCIVFIVMLAKDSNETGASQVANVLLHYVSPPLVVGSWLAFGPDTGLRFSDIPRVMIWPVLWVIYTLIAGAVSGWYPYGFVDAAAHGYPDVLASVALIFAFAIATAGFYILAARLRWHRRLTAPRELTSR